MFRLDLSLLSAHACRSDQDEYPGIVDPRFDDFVQKPTERRPTSKKFPSSPARTARTQTSSKCSVNNSFDTSIELDFLPTIGTGMGAPSESSSPGIFVPKSASRQYRPTMTKMNKRPSAASAVSEPGFGIIRRVPSADSTGKKSSTFSAMGKNVSQVGKTVLKNLRKNMSLVSLTSIDSGTSKRPYKLLKNFQKNNNNHQTIPLDVNLTVVEGGEGVEITTKASESDDSDVCVGSTSSSSSSGSSEPEDHFDMKVPKIIRETSTFATTSLTSGEETDNAEIYKDDADIRKLCSLMDKINSKDNKERIGSDFDYSSSASKDSSVESHSSPLPSSSQEEDSSTEEQVEEEDEALRASSKASPQEAGGDAFFDLMVFVNNEHRVLEYAHDEFQQFDSNESETC